MSGKIYHRSSFSSEEEADKHEEENQLVPANNYNHAIVPMYQKSVPTPGTYVVTLPKDQIYRIPPPENAHLFENYNRKKKNRPSNCCCVLFWILSLIILLGLLTAIASGIFYAIFQPKALEYSVEIFSIKGLNKNLTSSSGLKLSPEFDITVKSKNPNGKISFYYLAEGSSVTVSYSKVELSTGEFKTFHQPANNATFIQLALESTDGVQMSKNTRTSLMDRQEIGNIPFELDVNVPVKVNVGSLKTWTITLNVRCDVSTDKLTVNSTLVSNKCEVKAKH
ncbi:hypothetical protein C5167_047116 [Papaver somniferum]|uniref:Late embryogenesis abundant protein LEA-2 subgroup domain-containing protein n=1 Tax=Papaver somniferum TaxID=3469 RepID=A0A4Y7LHY6_PAPSO|nr:NDR1/HIN1-like protein 13 [Papaver somniferum]RZC84332.1 hypothetical protein C5167_047116 [Papaver somniferum]